MKKSLLATCLVLTLASPARASGSPVPEPVMWLLAPLAFIASLFDSNEPDQGQRIELDENGNIKPAPKASPAEPAPPVAPEKGGG